jgi:hypothetical protein
VGVPKVYHPFLPPHVVRAAQQGARGAGCRAQPAEMSSSAVVSSEGGGVLALPQDESVPASRTICTTLRGRAEFVCAAVCRTPGLTGSSLLTTACEISAL